ncbi:MAG: adenylate/guanylate cyclase domain-containing protein [Bacteroidetes bacterium]|nr:adenylate/guanylate cyclase domain-containing protein [Bacteroidota bacterium]
MNRFTVFLAIGFVFFSCNNAPNGSPMNDESHVEKVKKGSMSNKDKMVARIRFDSLLRLVENLNISEAKDSIPKHLNEALSIAHVLNNDSLRAQVYMELGGYFDAATEYYLMADYFYKAWEYYQKIQNHYGAQLALSNLAWGYIQANDFKKGIEKCREGIHSLKNIRNEKYRSRAAGFLYNNLSIAFLESNQADSALKYNELALISIPDFKEKELGLYSWVFTQFGCIYELKKDTTRAQECFNRSVEIRDSSFIPDASVYAISKYCHFLNGLGRFRDAIFFGRDGIRIAKKFHLDRYLIDVADELRYSYEKLLRVDSAYIYAKMTMEYKDTVFNTKKSIQLQSYSFNRDLKAKEFQHEIENAKAEENIRSEQKLRNIFLIGLILVMLFAGLFLFQRNKIRAGKIRSDELLLNILPEEVAEELKSKGSAEAQLIDEVTVLFTDFKGFTELSEKFTPKELIGEINECFSAFDHIMAKFGVEKIKTIGDAYMAAGGVPTTNTSHASDVVNAALAIQQYMHEHKIRREEDGKLYFEIRIGVHSGPVVAGIVGVKKFSYDIWGDTVNIANRMESSGEAGKVNISGTTYEMVKDEFDCSYRGKIQAKGKGAIDMYFVERSI